MNFLDKVYDGVFKGDGEYYHSGTTTKFAGSLISTGRYSIEPWKVWETLNELKAFVMYNGSDAAAYVGMVVTVTSDVNNNGVYIINNVGENAWKRDSDDLIEHTDGNKYTPYSYSLLIENKDKAEKDKVSSPSIIESVLQYFDESAINKIGDITFGSFATKTTPMIDGAAKVSDVQSIISNNEKVAAAAFNDLNNRIKSSENNSVLELYKGDDKATVVSADGETYDLKQNGNVVASFNILKDSFVRKGELVYKQSNGKYTKRKKEGDDNIPYLHLVINTYDATIGSDGSDDVVSGTNDVYVLFSDVFGTLDYGSFRTDDSEMIDGAAKVSDVQNIIDENEFILSTALNDIRQIIYDDEKAVEGALNDIYRITDENEIVVSTSLQDLNNKINNLLLKLNKHEADSIISLYRGNDMVNTVYADGELYELKQNDITIASFNISPSSGSTNDNSDVTVTIEYGTFGTLTTDLVDGAARVSDVQDIIVTNENINAAALNDLDTRLTELEQERVFGEFETEFSPMVDGVAKVSDVQRVLNDTELVFSKALEEVSSTGGKTYKEGDDNTSFTIGKVKYKLSIDNDTNEISITAFTGLSFSLTGDVVYEIDYTGTSRNILVTNISGTNKNDVSITWSDNANIDSDATTRTQSFASPTESSLTCTITAKKDSNDTAKKTTKVSFAPRIMWCYSTNENLTTIDNLGTEQNIENGVYNFEVQSNSILDNKSITIPTGGAYLYIAYAGTIDLGKFFLSKGVNRATLAGGFEDTKKTFDKYTSSKQTYSLYRSSAKLSEGTWRFDIVD